MFIVILFYYWLLVSASKGSHQTNIYKKIFKKPVILHKNINVFGISFTFVTKAE